MEKRKKISLKRYFTRSLLGLALGILLIIAFWMILLLLVVGSGAAVQANRGEEEVHKEIDRQRDSGEFLYDIKPEFFDYIYLDKMGEVRQSSLPETRWEKTINKYKDTNKTYYTGAWLVFPDNSKCLFMWKNRAVFADPVLRKMLPSVDTCVFTLMALSLILFFVITIWKISRRFQNLLAQMENVSKQIADKNLEDSCINETGIQEFDHALESMDSMRRALRTSVTGEWQKEQKRKEEMASLTHDIKAPLTVITGNTELLLEEVQREEDKELLQSIASAGNRARKYVDNLQTLSNLDIVTEERQDIKEKELIKNVMEVLQPLADAKAVKVTVTNDTGDLELRVDLPSMSRALVNIGENAIRYTPKGSTIKLLVRQECNFVSFIFCDEGPGFTKEALSHAKDMFWQADKSRTTNNNYGMGLAIADHIAEDYGGKLELKNTDAGACVVFSIRYNQ